MCRRVKQLLFVFVCLFFFKFSNENVYCMTIGSNKKQLFVTVISNYMEVVASCGISYAVRLILSGSLMLESGTASNGISYS